MKTRCFGHTSGAGGLTSMILSPLTRGNVTAFANRSPLSQVPLRLVSCNVLVVVVMST